MESRRLRLLLFAYLRGLLKPNYPNGIQSIIREELVLFALSKELDADYLIKQAEISSSFSKFIDPKKIKNIYSEVSNKILVARKLKEYKSEDALKPKGIDSSIRIYNALVSAGIIQNDDND